MQRILTKNPKETQKLARLILENFLLKKEKGASIIAFSGKLGAGKTTLIQGIGKTLGIKEKIQSPTFVLMRTYPLKKSKKIMWEQVIHIDAYRLEKKSEIAALGLKPIFKNPKNLVLIEWAEKIKKILPKKTLWVELRHAGKTHRHILIKK